jgi:hypothetical protein
MSKTHETEFANGMALTAAAAILWDSAEGGGRERLRRPRG